MLKFIVGGVLVLLVWILRFILEIPNLIAILITLLILLVVAFLFVIEKLRERRAARDLERAIAAQAAQQAASARPDLQHEIAEMNAEFQKAVSALKTSKKGGKKALYALPWYTIIGPPGAGKSTALRNSGLQFPYLSASGGGVRGLGGTRNCDWWMTSEAVILDTAGRWTSEDEDRDEWLAFLDLTKRFRPKKPLNGIIAAVSIGELGGAREDEVVQLARRIRERIDEVQNRLSLSLPVYVLFTKCDLIPGFLETFGDMSKEDRSQAWGHTAPLTKPIGSPGEYFAQGFDKLVGILEVRAPKRMSDERKIASREMVYAFPQQLAVLRQNLAEFVHHLFLENVFKETPRFRGFYFTSGTQEGRPIDRVMSRMAEAFGQPQVQLPAPQVESKSYFLRDMFAKIVFMDAEVAARSPEEVSRQRRNTFLAAAAIFMLALGLSGLPAISYARNVSFLRATKDIVDLARRSTAGESDEPIDPRVIEPLRARAMLLEEYDDGAPVFMGMGMYQDEVYEPVRGVYLDVLRRRAIGPLVRADVDTLDTFVGQFQASHAVPQATTMRDNYDRLKLHILLTVEREDTEPPLDEDLQRFVREQLTARWRRAAGVRSADREWNLIGESTQYYVNSLSRDQSLFFERETETVAAVQTVFRTVGGLDMAVQGIVAAVDRTGPNMTLAVLIGSEVTDVRAGDAIPFAFTRDAWDRRVRRMLQRDAARFFGEHWVLGNEPPANAHEAERLRQAQLEALKSHYLMRYAAEWRRFVASLQYNIPHTDEEHHRMLTQLTSGDPRRITMLFRMIDRNLTLADAPPERDRTRDALQNAGGRALRKQAKRLLRKNAGAAEAAGRRRLSAMAAAPVVGDPWTTDRVRREFEGFLDFCPLVPPPPQEGQPSQEGQYKTPAETYEEQLEFLRNAVESRITESGPGADPARVAEQNLRVAAARETARAVTNRLINERPLEWRPRFQSLLNPPIEGAVPLPPPAPVVPVVPPVPGVVAPAVPAAPVPAPVPPQPAPRRAQRPQRPFQAPVPRPLGF